MRCLAVDLGEKRVGLAISEATGLLTLPLDTLARRDDRSLIRQIGEVARREEVGIIFVGEPVTLDGRRTAAAHRAAGFARKLARATGLPCELIGEALTSIEAEERLRHAGVDPRRHPERVDAVAAQILLEEALGRLGRSGS